MEEPGVDKHVWVRRWEALEDDLREAPAEAIGEADQLVADMLAARGFPLGETDGAHTREPETLRQFAEARRVTRQIDAGEATTPATSRTPSTPTAASTSTCSSSARPPASPPEAILRR